MSNYETLENALKTVHSELGNAQEEIYQELVKQFANTIEHFDCGKKPKRQGNPKHVTSLNNYHNYLWVEVNVNNKLYWITLFYNDVDKNSGNFHTQLGRIQFWKNINTKKKSPNQKCPGGRWVFCFENSYNPKIWITDDNYSPQRVVQAFKQFLKDNNAI